MALAFSGCVYFTVVSKHLVVHDHDTVNLLTVSKGGDWLGNKKKKETTSGPDPIALKYYHTQLQMTALSLYES